MSFKLLAICAFEDCNTRILKNLEKNKIYKFYNDYEFEDGIGYGLIDNQPPLSVKIVKNKRKSVPENLYGENINVSAIVGKNGSGKSALVELLVATIIKISLIVDEKFISPEELYYNGSENFDEIKFDTNVNKFKKSIETDLENLKVEIYYQHDSKYCFTNKSNKVISYNSGGRGIKIRCIQLDGENIIIKDQVNENVTYFKLIDLDQANPDNQKLSEELFYFLGNLFYSVVINYSHYGFNSNEVGEWIKGVFHKNDGYQLPVVINPYRDKGNIDINSEMDLARSRFLVNILQEEQLRAIQINKKITHISIKLDESKFRWDQSKMRDLRILNNEDDKKKVLNLICEKFSILKDLYLNAGNYFFNYTFDYILIKLYKMTNYPIYRYFKSCFEEISINIDGKIINQFRILPNELFEIFLDSLVGNFSHVTHKFRQALFFLEWTYFDLSDVYDNDNVKVLEIDLLYNWINSSYLNGLNIAIERFASEDEVFFKESLMKRYNVGKFELHHSLPSFFKIEYYFEEKVSNNTFSNLSSGEKQKIFSIHSVIYHLRNLISISENNAVGSNSLQKLIAYKNINIIFDEIELYAHPDFQRIFISDFLRSLKVIKTYDKNINIIFITHSPFILSDIPKQNVLFLEVDENNIAKEKDFTKMNTFGANIHDLLADSFFIGNDGLIGEFAKNKINELIDWLNDKNRDNFKKKYYEKVIELIDEPILKMKLAEMYDSIFRDDLRNKLKKKELKKLAKELNYKVEPKND